MQRDLNSRGEAPLDLESSSLDHSDIHAYSSKNLISLNINAKFSLSKDYKKV